MKIDRRNFIRTTGLLALVGVTGVETLFAASEKKVIRTSKKGLSLSFLPYDLQLRHVFTLANSSRKNTPDVLTRLEIDGVVGYGEASMPPYLEESVETAIRFLSLLDLGQFNDPFQMDDILQYVDSVMPGNTAAKAAVDIALHDLVGKLMKCTGMREAHQMLTLARSLDMKVMIGCMTETSCAISAAAQLAPKADWADLDGNLLISNDPYSGMQIVNGKVTLIDQPGIGVKEEKKVF